MIYIMSDIHGNKERFDSIMKQIKLKSDDTLYILGDIIDRSPDGIKILQKLMKMPNVKMLIGNHEYMMLEYLNYQTEDDVKITERELINRMKFWYQNGGRVTHDYIKHIRKDKRKEIFNYLEGLPLNYEIEVNGQKYVLVHGGMESEFYRDATNEYRYDNVKEYCVWTRDSDRVKVPKDTILIFGHTPTEYFQDIIPLRIWHGENRIGIDCGCGYHYPGRLGCIRLDDMKEFYSEYMSEEDTKRKERMEQKNV